MLTNYAERYVLRSSSIGGYLSVNSADQQIERKHHPTRPGCSTPTMAP